MKNHVKTITVCAVTFALTAVLGLLPYVFLIPLLFTCVTRDFKLSFAEGLFFGLLSLAYSFISPAPTPVALAFMTHPWIPIVPRVLVALGCHACYVGLRHAFRNKKGKSAVVIPVTLSCAIGSILNTALVVGCLLMVKAYGTGELIVFVSSVLVSGAIELGVSVLVAAPLSLTVGRALKLPDYMRLYVKPAKAAENTSEAAENVCDNLSGGAFSESDSAEVSEDSLIYNNEKKDGKDNDAEAQEQSEPAKGEE